MEEPPMEVDLGQFPPLPDGDPFCIPVWVAGEL